MANEPSTTATLIAYNPKFQCEIVPREALKAYPVPPATSRWRPIPHAELVGTLLSQLEAIDLIPTREQYAVGSKGLALFGALDLASANKERALAIGFRHSNDKALAVQIVGGARTFTCDNLALSGEKVALRKHSRGLHLAQIIRAGLEKWAESSRRFEASIVEAEARSISDDEAKVTLFDLRYNGVVPVSIFDEAATNYFKAETLGYEDSAPRTQWGLVNAVTRSVKALAPSTQFRVLTDLGKALGFGGSNN